MSDSSPPNFLLELGTEELPHQEIDGAAKQFEQHLVDAFERNNIEACNAKIHSTPRRLAMQAHLSKKSTTTSNEAIGPLWNIAVKEAKWTRAGEGFLRRHGFDDEAIRNLNPNKITLSVGNRPPNLTSNQAFKLWRGNKELLIVHKKESSEDLGPLLGRTIPEALKQIHFAKKMHWPQNDGIAFLRPIRWICSLLYEDIIPFKFAGVESDNTSFGRGHYPGDPDEKRIVIPHAKDYEATLKQHGVLPSAEERIDMISEYMSRVYYDEALESANHPKFREMGMSKDNVKLEHFHKQAKASPMVRAVANLVEYPTVRKAYFNKTFLDLPFYVIAAEVQEHQKGFIPLMGLHTEGKYPKNIFYFVSNNGDKKHIREGNEHVLNARLNDGLFLYNKDMAVSEAEWEERLRNLIEHPELGSYSDLVNRQQRLAKSLFPIFKIEKEVEEELLKSLRILKWDVTSDMVAEFPNLQGYMSRFYARLDDWNMDYYYDFLRDRKNRNNIIMVPTNMLGTVDLLDTLMSRMAIGIKATGSHDPYGLRRTAINLAHLLIKESISLPSLKFPESSYSFDLAEAVKLATPLYEPHYTKHGYNKKNFEDAVITFIKSRLKDAYKEHDFSASDVAICLRGETLDLLDLYGKLKAFSSLRKEGKLNNLRHVLKRIKNITEPVERPSDVHPDLFETKEEEALHVHHEAQKKAMEEFYRHRDYPILFERIIGYEGPLKAFFDHVMVNVEDKELRSNRVALLWQIRKTIDDYIDFDELLILK